MFSQKGSFQLPKEDRTLAVRTLERATRPCGRARVVATVGRRDGLLHGRRRRRRNELRFGRRRQFDEEFELILTFDRDQKSREKER